MYKFSTYNDYIMLIRYIVIITIMYILGVGMGSPPDLFSTGTQSAENSATSTELQATGPLQNQPDMLPHSANQPPDMLPSSGQQGEINQLEVTRDSVNQSEAEGGVASSGPDILSNGGNVLHDDRVRPDILAPASGNEPEISASLSQNSAPGKCRTLLLLNANYT